MAADAYEELFQEGCVGLLFAVRKFDHRRGRRFSTYAMFWIRAYVGAAAARLLMGSVVPTKRASEVRQLRGLESELTQRLGRTVENADVAAELGRTVEWARETAALEAPQSLEVVSEADIAAEDRGLAAILSAGRPGRELLAHLRGRHRRVIELRFGFVGAEPQSRTEVAARLGLSVSQVRRFEAEAIERLRGVCPQQAIEHLAG